LILRPVTLSRPVISSRSVPGGAGKKGEGLGAALAASLSAKPLAGAAVRCDREADCAAVAATAGIAESWLIVHVVGA
jgi:hypothetical protein